MLKIQEVTIGSTGEVQITLPEGSKILQAVTIGGVSMVRAYVDTANPNTTYTLNIVSTGNDIGKPITEQQWLGSVTFGGGTKDVFLETA
jgi:hypothetical protein